MNAQKRLRPMMSASEVFRIPQVLFIPALLGSCALIPLNFLAEPPSMQVAVGAAFAALIFAALTYFVWVIPVLSALRLHRDGADGSATILKKEKRPRTFFTANYNMRLTDNYITFEFTPQGAATPLRLEAEIGRMPPNLAEGKTAKIRYSASNPRIVKFGIE
jgi:hypothetical protein